jgi:hypothetical protein
MSWFQLAMIRDAKPSFDVLQSEYCNSAHQKMAARCILICKRGVKMELSDYSTVHKTQSQLGKLGVPDGRALICFSQANQACLTMGIRPLWVSHRPGQGVGDELHGGVYRARTH